jgi:two-component system sensor histidine kinase VicK
MPPNCKGFVMPSSDQFRRGNIPDTSLGLSIAQAIVKAHGGRITVESLIGWGSVFTVFLPANE